MQRTTVLAALTVGLIAVAGAAAAGATSPGDAPGTNASLSDAEVDATYDNGTLTVAVTDAGDPAPNVTVYYDEATATTGPDGTVDFQTEADEEVEIEAEAPGFDGEVEYAVDDGSLTLLEEEYEYGENAGDGEGETGPPADAGPSENAGPPADAGPSENAGPPADENEADG